MRHKKEAALSAPPERSFISMPTNTFSLAKKAAKVNTPPASHLSCRACGSNVSRLHSRGITICCVDPDWIEVSPKIAPVPNRRAS
jgi:hypothetical protein